MNRKKQILLLKQEIQNINNKIQKDKGKKALKKQRKLLINELISIY